MWTAAWTQEDRPQLLTGNIKLGMGLVECHNLAVSSLLPSSYSDWSTAKGSQNSMKQEQRPLSHRIHPVCLAQKEKMETARKEVGLKIALTNVERCWGRNCMWYQVKNTCFSQVQIRTTHRLLECSNGRDQCRALDFEQHFFLLWTAMGIWLMQDCLQYTLRDFRSC